MHASRLTSFAVHNPGALADAEYFTDPNFEGAAELTVVFEDTHNNWLVKVDILIEQSSAYDHTAFNCPMYSVLNLDTTDMDELLLDVWTVGRGVYLTESNNHTTIDSYFPVFADCLNQLVR